MITVDLLKGHPSDGLADLVRDLYQYWKPGVEPPSFEDAPAANRSRGGVLPAMTVAVATVAGAALSEAAKRVPVHLLERASQRPRTLERQERLTSTPVDTSLRPWCIERLFDTMAWMELAVDLLP